MIYTVFHLDAMLRLLGHLLQLQDQCVDVLVGERMVLTVGNVRRLQFMVAFVFFCRGRFWIF